MRTRAILFFTLLVTSYLPLIGVPADNVVRYVLQPDGSTLAVRLYGDEYYHFHATTDNYPICEKQDGGWYFLTMKGKSITQTMVLAHNPKDRQPTEKKFLQSQLPHNVLSQLQDSLIAKWEYNRKKTHALSQNNHLQRQFIKIQGKKKGLVILVNFANKEMSASNAQKYYTRMFNQIGFSENNHIGSVHDYFFDQSYGQFDLEFDVVGPVTVSKDYGYYGTNGTEGNGADLHAEKMIREACILAAPYVNYKDYDWNNDGTVSQVFIIYAGYGEATGGPANTIWPHKSNLANYEEGPLVIQNMQIGQYACCNELYFSTGHYMGIGTACHEFSHCLGLPDFYDVNYSGGWGMGCWDIMNSGSYAGPNGIGEVPYGYSAYERWYIGWMEPTEISKTQHLGEVEDLGQSPQAFVLYNDGQRDEYYIVENHQSTKWFSYAQTKHAPHGMLVTHVDYNKDSWLHNKVNTNPEHQRMSIIPADGELSNSNLETDFYPSEKQISKLTNASHENCGGRLYNANLDGTYYLNKEIKNIYETDGYISFDIICNNDIPTPELEQITDYKPDGFTVIWKSLPNAEYYIVELARQISRKPVTWTYEEFGPIYDNKYLFSELESGTYRVRVKGIIASITTEWSRQEEVTLTATSIYNQPHSSFHPNYLYYNISGVAHLKNCVPSIYIKKTKDNVQKIIVK